MFFHPNWHNHNRFTTAQSHKATIRIYRESSTGESSWTPEEGLTTPEDILIYEGLARWQKRGQTTSQDFADDVARFQRVQIEISMKRLGNAKLRVNDRVELVENPSNPHSEGSVVYVWGFPTSSNAWQILLICQENYKQVASGT